MTTKIPDAVIERVAKAMFVKPISDSRLADVRAGLEALDLSGIIADLEFYGDEENWKWKVQPQSEWLYNCGAKINGDCGHRARERLGKLLNEGGKK